MSFFGRFFTISLFSVTLPAFAGGFYSLFSLNSSPGNLYLSQDAKAGCNDPAWQIEVNMASYTGGPHGISGNGGFFQASGGQCLGVADDGDPQALYDLVQEHWGNAEKNLMLASDIDLHEFDETTPAGTCLMNHVPLDFSTAHVIFDGNGFWVKNLCYVHDVASGAMTQPAGFFSSIKEHEAVNVNFKNVRMVVSDSRADRDVAEAGADYYPVGALAGYVWMSTVRRVSLQDVDIQAPVAGALAGNISASTVSDITANDDILIHNVLELSNEKGNFAGSTLFDWGSRYSVFLGGIAGFAFQVDFKNLTVRAKVQDSSSAATQSALGGVAGLYAYAGFVDATVDSSSVVMDNIKLDSSDSGKAYTKISGGMAMGGIFGEAGITYGTNGPYSSAVANLSIVNSAGVVGISESNADSVFAGGLVGRVSVFKGASFSLQKDTVKVMVKDSLTRAVSHAYYAGGLLGLAGETDAANLTDDSFVSIVGSRAQGSISVAGSATAVGDGFDVNAYLGGFAGIAILSVNGKGLLGCRSDVDIRSNLKSSYEGELVNSYFPAYDSIFVGGFFGIADILGNGTKNDLELLNSTYTGSISVADSVSPVYVGGILGAFFNRAVSGGTKSVSFRDVTVDASGDNLIRIDASGSNFEKPSASMVGGICGYCYALRSMQKSGASGNIAVQGAFGTDSLLAGGLVGATVTYADVEMKNAFYVGNLVSVDAAPVKTGYLFGKLDATAKVDVFYAYHYGEDAVEYPYGAFKYSGNDATASWKVQNGQYASGYVIRNGAVQSLDENSNGTEVSATMQKSAFAGFMNTDQSPYVWAFEQGENGSLPFIAWGPHSAVAPISVVAFHVNFMDKDGKTLVGTQTVKSGEAAVAPEPPEHEGYTFAGWDKAFDNVESDLTVTARYTINSYKVVFKEGERELFAKEFEYGTMPVYDGETPTKPATELHTWTWTGWEPALAPVKGDAVYHATFRAVEIPVSSSSAEVSSSSVPESSSSLLSSSSVLLSSSSEMQPASSSEEVAESSSSGEYEISSSSEEVPESSSGIEMPESSSDRAVEPAHITMEAHSWQLVSVAAFKDMESFGEESAFYWWDERNPIGEYWQYRRYDETEKYDATRGFWFGTFESKTIELRNSDPEEASDIEWELDSLYSGWNLVANPYSWNIVLDADDYSDVQFWQWNPETSEYEIADTLAPYEAIWAKVSRPVTVRIPAKPAAKSAPAVAGASKRMLAKSANGNGGWNLRVMLSDKNGKRDSWNFIGVGDESTLAEPPAGMGDFVNLSIVEDNQRLAKSVKARSCAAEVDCEFVWNMEASATSARKASLSFEGLEDVVAAGLRVFVAVDGRTFEATDGKAMEISLEKNAKPVTLRVSRENVAVAGAAKFSNFRFVQQGSLVGVSFDAAPGLAGSEGRVDIVSVNGKVVASERLVARRGENTAYIATSVKGLYFVRVHLENQVGIHRIVLK